MGETQKPFPCTSAGCPMTFTNEDHLTLHQKKHDMNLNLELNCKNSYVDLTADQTPTPTRFIRNCEEVGLFQDLQNVNPFEETFRKAVESGKTGSLHIPDNNQDDSLHTPQIYPPLEETNKYRSTFSISRVPSIDENLLPASEPADNLLTTTDTSLTTNTTPLCDKIDVGIVVDDGKNDCNITVTKPRFTRNNLLMRRSSRNQLEKDTSITFHHQSPSTSKTDIKTKIKNALKNRQKSTEEEVLEEDDEDNCFDSELLTFIDVDDDDISPEICLIQRKKPCESNGVTITPLVEVQKKSTNTNNGKEKIRDSRSHYLEHKRAINRAAQFRSRQRKKNWLDGMEKQMSNLMVSNKSMRLENEMLRNEVQILKKILLLHQDCSASRDLDINAQIQTLAAQIKPPTQNPPVNLINNSITKSQQQQQQIIKYPPIAPQAPPVNNVLALIPTVIPNLTHINNGSNISSMKSINQVLSIPYMSILPATNGGVTQLAVLQSNGLGNNSTTLKPQIHNNRQSTLDHNRLIGPRVRRKKNIKKI